MNEKKDFLVGIYDERVRFAGEFVKALGHQRVLTLGCPSASVHGYLAAENVALSRIRRILLRLRAADLHIFVKDFFLTRCENIVIVLGGIESFSMAVSAIRYLISGTPDTVTVVGTQDLSQLIALGEPDESRILESLSAQGRLQVVKEFSLSEWLSHRV